MAVFNSSKPANNLNSGSPNIINSGTKIIGDLASEGDMRIDGQVKGYIECKARLVIGNTAIIDGDIKAGNLEISGKLNGNISVNELLTVKSTAVINGDIITSKLIIEAGAEFNGHSSMKDTKQNPIKLASAAASGASV